MEYTDYFKYTLDFYGEQFSANTGLPIETGRKLILLANVIHNFYDIDKAGKYVVEANKKAA